MALSIMIARIRIKTYSKAYGVFGNVKAIENRITLNNLRMGHLSPLTATFREIAKETRELEKYREAILRLRDENEA